MYKNTCSINGRLRIGDLVSARLNPIHDEWIEEARRFLLPAISTDATFWDRWSAVRYLSDQYTERHRVESQFVAHLAPFMPARDHGMLMAGGLRVARLRLTLDQLGRRRVTASEFARAVTDFLKALELWCAEIELAASHVEADALPPEARRSLDRLVKSSRIPSTASA